MKFVKAIFSGILVFSTVLAHAQNDEKMIEKQVGLLVSDFNTHAFKNMDTYTTEDVEWVNIVGMHWKGRNDVQLAHQRTFDAFFNKGPFTQKKLVVRLVTPDVAIAHLTSHVGEFFPPDGIDHGGNKWPESDNLLILVYAKKKGVWLLTAAQNTVVDARAAANNPIKN